MIKRKITPSITSAQFSQILEYFGAFAAMFLSIEIPFDTFLKRGGLLTNWYRKYFLRVCVINVSLYKSESGKFFSTMSNNEDS